MPGRHASRKNVRARYGAAVLVALLSVALSASIRNVSAAPADAPDTSGTVVTSARASLTSETTSEEPAGTDRVVDPFTGRPVAYPAVQPVAVPGTLTVTSPKGGHTWTASALAEHDVPAAAQRAYQHAAATMAVSDPTCRLPWTLLAGIGRVESNHGRYGGSVLGADGVSRPRIVGVPLNGAGAVAAIRDTDRGVFDGDTVWDHAVGSMQFIPSTWRGAARDGDGDGVESPNDIDDAAMAAAAYLCSGPGSLTDPAAMRAAVLRYNPSQEYADLVLAFAAGYRTGVFTLPSPPVPAATQHHHRRNGHRSHRGGHTAGARGHGPRGNAHHPHSSTPTHAPSHHPGTRPTPGPGSPVPVTHGPGGPSATPTHKPTHQPHGGPTPTCRASAAGAGASATARVSATPSRSPSASTSGPAPSPSGSTDPSPTSATSRMSAAASPTLTSLTGTLTACGGGWYLAAGRLDVGTADQLAAVALHDYDGDGTVEANVDELTGLAGQTVHVQVAGSSAAGPVVYRINELAYRVVDGAPAS